MSDRNALDLSSVDPPIWRVMVDEAVYGPYTLGQMKAFAEEGRLADMSMVAAGDGGAFKNAFEHPELRPLIPGRAEAPKADAQITPSNFFITIQSDADGRRAVISLLNTTGRFAELMPGSFILNATISVTALREKLSTVLAERGRFVIANASTGQLAWMGLKDEAGGYAKTVWKRAP